MTRRFWLPLAVAIASLYALGVWALGVVRVHVRLADAINGGKR